MPDEATGVHETFYAMAMVGLFSALKLAKYVLNVQIDGPDANVEEADASNTDSDDITSRTRA